MIEPKRGFSEILLMLIVIIIIIVGGFMFINDSREEPPSIAEQSQKNQSSEIKPNYQDDWIEYTHEQGRFSFWHPKDIKYTILGPFHDSDSEQGVIDRIIFGNTEELYGRYDTKVSDNLKFNLVVYKNSPIVGTTLDEFLEIYNRPFEDDRIRKTYNPSNEHFTNPYVEGVYLYKDTAGLPPTIVAIITNGERLVSISVLTEGEEGDTLFKEIIQSFRFN